ncbi:hypothetical protein GCM10009624_06990 [Gordonia sinesedis]
MFVLTVDQRDSRRDVDRVDDLLGMVEDAAVVRAFERTAGDEVQAVIADPAVAADLLVRLATDGHWSVGVGVGAVATPLPASTRAGRGPAFEYAREAVERAKNERTRLAVTGADPTWTGHAQTAARLLVDLLDSRSAAGAEAVELVRSGRSQSDAAAILGISPQAMSQRLRSARWDHEDATRNLLTDLLERADTMSTPESR